jgi:hypothetical protein
MAKLTCKSTIAEIKASDEYKKLKLGDEWKGKTKSKLKKAELCKALGLKKPKKKTTKKVSKKVEEKKKKPSKKAEEKKKKPSKKTEEKKKTPPGGLKLESPKKPGTPKKVPSPKKPSTPKKVPSPKKPSTPKKVPSPKKPSTPKKAPSPKKPSTPKKVPSPKKPTTPKPEVKERKRPATPKTPQGKLRYAWLDTPGFECMYLGKGVRTKEQTEYLRRKIHKEIVKKHGHVLNDQVLQDLFDAYDKEFFNNEIKKHAKKKNYTFSFAIGEKMTSTAGVCSFKTRECKIQIKISRPIYNEIFSKGENSHRLGGLLCYDKLECVQLIFEHELIHALIDLFCPEIMQRQAGYKKRGNTHPKTFTEAAFWQFGHTEYRHDLLGGEGSALEKKSEQAKEFKQVLKKGAKVLVYSGKEKRETEATILNDPVKGANRISMRLADGRRFGIPYVSIIKIIDLNPKVEKSEAEVKVEKLKGELKAGTLVTVKLHGIQGENDAVLLVGPKKNAGRVRMKMLTSGKVYIIPFTAITKIKGYHPELLAEKTDEVKAQLKIGVKVLVNVGKGEQVPAEVLENPRKNSKTILMRFPDKRELRVPIGFVVKVIS